MSNVHILHSSFGRWAAALLLTVSLLFTQATALAAESAYAVQTDEVTEYKQFLQAKYDINLNGNITKGQFIQAIAKIVAVEPGSEQIAFTDLPADDPQYPAAAALYEQGIIAGTTVGAKERLTSGVAVALTVRAAGLKELAYTYPQDKVAASLALLQVKSGSLGVKLEQELAAAVDTGFLPASLQSNFDPTGAANEQLVHTLLGKLLMATGKYKQFLGYVNDDDIFAKVYSAYVTSDLITADKLQKLMNTALEQELVTGYSLKDSRYDANFIPSLSLAYGHADLTHALQLIGLLRSEGLNAKVQLEPKTSAFVHLAEWGDPGPHVVQIANGNYIAYAKEYDLQFEFASAEEKAAFQEIILTYAKKNEQDQAGLIYGSWWQPLYFSDTELADYEIITNNLIIDKETTFKVNSFSLNEDAERVGKGLRAIDPDVTIIPYQFWVDKPFFNYLHGEAL